MRLLSGEWLNFCAVNCVSCSGEVQPPVRFEREGHIQWARRGLFKPLSSGYASLDSARPWLLYWNLHSLDLLDARPNDDELELIRLQAERCISLTGGIAGAQHLEAHLASAYAGVSTLMLIGTPASYATLDRQQTYEWLMSLKQPDGSFAMHHGGEIDSRSAYCAVVIATYYNMLTPALRRGLADWLVRCQSYEGGLGGSPGTEAHGGYTFCGVAALSLLGELHRLNVPRLLHWMSHRQMKLEGGFQGRTNKLVDSCYSLWQGALFAMMAGHVKEASPGTADPYLLHRGALQDYLLVCSQIEDGGFRDKPRKCVWPLWVTACANGPGRSRDFYHTCYGLSGLSISQFLMLPTEAVGGVREEAFADESIFLGQTVRPFPPVFYGVVTAW